MSKFDLAGEGPVGGGKLREYTLDSSFPKGRELRLDTNFVITAEHAEWLLGIEGVDEVNGSGRYCRQIMVGQLFDPETVKSELVKMLDLMKRPEPIKEELEDASRVAEKLDPDDLESIIDELPMPPM